jgi:uncharacterized membrane protein (UPF0182 family)
MYVMLIILLLCIAAGLILWGLRQKKISKVVFGVVILASTFLFFNFLSFWSDVLWFDSLGYLNRFWKVILYRALFAVLGGIIGFAVLWILTLFVFEHKKTRIHWIPALVGLYVGAKWGSANWDTILLYLKGPMTGTQDPVLHKDVGFYLFNLPFYEQLYIVLFGLCIVALVSVFAGIFLTFKNGRIDLRQPQLVNRSHDRRVNWLYLNISLFLFVLAWGRYLDRFQLLYSRYGAVFGAGWTDVNIKLPALNIMIVIMVAGAVFLVIPALRKFARLPSLGGYTFPYMRVFTPLVFIIALTAVVWGTSLKLVPDLFQWLRVSPNEISFEKPYIANNIELTRQAYGLESAEEKEFPVNETLTLRMIDENMNLIKNVRLWDWRALKSVYKQFQEIRLYYEFSDVDVDRYRFADSYREVMVSARELQQKNLPAQSQTFVNRRFIYTHGYGMTLTTVSEFTPQGLPNLLIKDIPPVSKYPELKVDQPRIYYGELTDSYVVVNTEEEEFDYPRGESNAYFRYDGKGGIQITNFWRKFLLGWRFDGSRFLFSDYPTAQSRIMFDRRIHDRVKKLAPFLHYDDDPYIVLVEGRMYWLQDAYTVSSNYPYSEPFVNLDFQNQQPGITGKIPEILRETGNFNYIRNSVKVIIDAYQGDVNFYVFEPGDPLIQAWRAIFPSLFKNRDQMPEGLYQHIRYPSDLLLVQGLVYTKYHMTDPEVFYNQEDLWVRATETYYGQLQPVEPYYIMWQQPHQTQAEFILMMPFTPKNRQVLIGWIAGMCDPGNYGRLLAYKFPKEKRVLGTQQMETKIDQDRFLSGQLSLWDQRGSRVIRGNVLVIPIEETLLYIEPIYLQAETAAYPELRLVAVMHNDNLSYAPTFDEALRGLFEETQPAKQLEMLPEETTIDNLVENADQAFNNYLQYLGNKQFQKASEELTRLQEALTRLKASTSRQSSVNQQTDK